MRFKFNMFFLCLPFILDASLWSPEKVLSLRKIDTVCVSPDHSKAAYLVKTADLQTQSWKKQLFVFDLEKKTEMILAEHLNGIERPSWSRDGETIWFLAKGVKSQALWKGSIKDGKIEKIDEAEEDMTSYALSPDEKKLAYLCKWSIQEKYPPALAYETTRPNALWIKKIGLSEMSHLITTEKMCVGFCDQGELSWSPDSALVAFSYVATDKGNCYAERWTSHLALADANNFKYKDLVRENSMNSNPRYSHDGTSIAFVSNASSMKRKESGQFFLQEVHIISPNGKKRKKLAETFDQHPELLGWAKNDETIFVMERKGVKEKIYQLSRGNRDVKMWPEKEAAFNFTPFLNASGDFFGLINREFLRPPEVFVTPVDAFKPEQISSLQPKDLPSLGTAELLQWSAKDGTSIEGILILPAGYKKDKPLPLILACHGGPTYAWPEEFIGSAEDQAVPMSFGLLADAGYAILAPNPRGSAGYGPKFAMKNFKDLGGKDLGDVLSGVDFLVKKGIADPKRLAIWGWSYGGYLSARAITQTSQFKAAVIGAGLTDLISFDGTSDLAHIYLQGYFDTYVWQDETLYLKRSPIMEIAKVGTPTLLQYGMKDKRVPMTQGIEFFKALKTRGVPTELFLFPHEEHTFEHNPQSIVAGLKQLLDWLNAHTTIDENPQAP